MVQKTQVLAMADESTCDGQRKYLRWSTKVLAMTNESTFIFKGSFL